MLSKFSAAVKLNNWDKNGKDTEYKQLLSALKLLTSVVSSHRPLKLEKHTLHVKEQLETREEVCEHRIQTELPHTGSSHGACCTHHVVFTYK